ncbi:hypothetical protein SAMN04487866_10949 [Thermoactinomyces sp. DSM 45891]|uniref:hypothetical protein n=1 Tax=Thermoactinomyces sp. DSM 45891 TaxID=1761907 RepID=UPI000910F78E|nr:hypothetical protein [Thermoactinomyces sp. DSM 45891]SFX48434.1 hypothetical protein SAMN04487866_10949 [Thermoactinomyces sp. DSM 45891]
MDEIRKTVDEVKTEVKAFGPRQETFLQNTWSLVFNLVRIVGALIVILGAIIGIKLAIPIFN